MDVDAGDLVSNLELPRSSKANHPLSFGKVPLKGENNNIHGDRFHIIRVKSAHAK